MTEKEDVRSEHPSNKDKVECGWCGKTFVSDKETEDNPQSSYEKEGIHRAKEHINADESIEQPDEKRGLDKNKVDDWKRNAERQKQGGKA